MGMASAKCHLTVDELFDPSNRKMLINEESALCYCGRRVHENMRSGAMETSRGPAVNTVGELKEILQVFCLTTSEHGLPFHRLTWKVKVVGAFQPLASQVQSQGAINKKSFTP